MANLGPNKPTQRGFGRIDFKDQYGVECSLQESSLSGGPFIWLGCNEANVRGLIPGQSWQPVKMPDREWIADTRMHLGQDQVRALIADLQVWLDNGSIPEEVESDDSKEQRRLSNLKDGL